MVVKIPSWSAALALTVSLTGAGLHAQDTVTPAVPANTNATVKLSPEEKARLKDFQKRNDTLLKIFNTHPTDWSAYEAAVRAKMKDFPEFLPRDIYGNAYNDLSLLIGHYGSADPARARALAQEVAESHGPEHFRQWAGGLLKRLDSTGKPVTFQFTALDGHLVDSKAFAGKVVLLDFWATTCPGCVETAPALKTTYDKFHPQGLEIIGISGDTEMKTVRRFVEKRHISWSQFVEQKPNVENRFFVEFGVYTMPHLILLDRQGRLRFDGIRAGSELDEKITMLLAE